MLSHLTPHLSGRQVRQRIAYFWEKRGHVEVPGIPLVPQNDPTTLFTGSGMQQFVPNLLGEPHPSGTRLYNIQRCVRAQDIEEVGNNRHDTFFEMVGNWSLGDYFKAEQLPWMWDLYTNKEYGFGLDPARLYVTVFAGGDGMEPDTESIEIWKDIFTKAGLHTSVGTAESFDPTQHITQYDAQKNWWSRAGTPSQMPIGEIGGPDSEIFYDFDPENQQHLHEHSSWKSEPCHVNCDCGRFMEIGNSVFIQFKKNTDGQLTELPKKNVDFGGGLERILAAINGDPDVFKTDVFAPIIRSLTSQYDNAEQDIKKQLRIIADHIRTAVNMAADGIVPGPKQQGYVMRTLIRRSILSATKLFLNDESLISATKASVAIFKDSYPLINDPHIFTTVAEEIKKYKNTIANGKQELKKRLQKREKVDGSILIQGAEVFEIYQSTGLPPDVIVEIGNVVGALVKLNGFEEAKKAHADLSRGASEQKFKGGLADHSEQVLRYHTATHLLHQALTDIVSPDIRQEGSNITGERLRFDFYSPAKPTPEQIVKIAELVNGKIIAALPVTSYTLPKVEAVRLGAKSFFREKYPDEVKVYVIGGGITQDPQTKRYTLNATSYSTEFCGGPHVTNTHEIGTITIKKIEKIGKDLYRLYAY